MLIDAMLLNCGDNMVNIYLRSRSKRRLIGLKPQFSKGLTEYLPNPLSFAHEKVAVAIGPAPTWRIIATDLV
jgi:hypothetical protein